MDSRDKRLTEYAKQKISEGQFDGRAMPVNLRVRVLRITGHHVALEFALVEQGTDEVLLVAYSDVVLPEGSSVLFTGSDDDPLLMWPISLEDPPGLKEHLQEMDEVLQQANRERDGQAFRKSLQAYDEAEAIEQQIEHMGSTDETNLL